MALRIQTQTQGNLTTFSSRELPPGALMTSRIQPNSDGKMGWFAFEELVRSWVGCCVVEKESQGPLLKS
eukprot:4699174-Prorocentrum_lima.AAC.1